MNNKRLPFNPSGQLTADELVDHADTLRFIVQKKNAVDATNAPKEERDRALAHAVRMLTKGYLTD